MIRKLSRSVREYKKDAIKTSLFVIIEIFLDILIPVIMSFLVDNGINKGNIKSIILYGIILVFLAISALLFGYLSGKYASIASSGFVKNLRNYIFKKINEFSFSNIDKFSTSSLITRITTDSTNVQNAFQMLIRVAVRAPLMFLFSIIAVISINPSISSIFVVIIPCRPIVPGIESVKAGENIGNGNARGATVNTIAAGGALYRFSRFENCSYGLNGFCFGFV